MRALLWILAPSLLAGCGGFTPVLPATMAARGAVAVRALAYGTYEWNVDDAVLRWREGTLWKLLARKHVDDLLAGFDDAQIAKYSTRAGSAEFNAFVAQAARHGVRVELLLGDPSWIVPSGIGSLEAILRKLQRIDFAGLNLDLEPNQVRGRPFAAVLKDLVYVMRAYVRASRWPVTLDLNVIYADPARTDGYCLVCGLQQAGLERVDLMTYVANPRVVAKEDRPLLARYPSIAFGVAQSVEPPSVLPRGDSYWSDGFTRFYADMRRLDALMSGLNNYRGIVVESMQYLETMPNS